MQLRSATGTSSTRNGMRQVPLIPKDSPPQTLYSAALHYARSQAYPPSRVLFERLLRSAPNQCKAWVSYAMMEKKATPSLQDRYDRCRQVLQRGLRLNPQSSCIVQAWGLMELQRQNWLAALLLLERSVNIDPRLQPVLKWSQVDNARKTVASRRRRPQQITNSA